MSTEHPVTLVTAASRGMGAAIAGTLAQAGHGVVLMATSEAVLTLAEELGGIGYRGSVTSADDLGAFVETAMAAHGRVDCVVNNSGHPPKGELLELTDEQWHAGMEMVMLNVVRMARLVTPIMQRQGRGAIVNISTYAAFEPEAAFPVSASMRAALAGFVKMYADRYAREGIRMNDVLPGFIDSHPENETMLRRIPMGRYGRVGEVAAVVRFLLSEEAGYLTGQNIRVDGGMTRSV